MVAIFELAIYYNPSPLNSKTWYHHLGEFLDAANQILVFYSHLVTMIEKMVDLISEDDDDDDDGQQPSNYVCNSFGYVKNGSKVTYFSGALMLILKIASLVCQALFNGLSQLFDTIHNLIAIATLIALVAFGFIVHFSTVSVQPRQAKTDWWSIFFDLAPLVLCGPHLICSFLVFMANPLQDPLNVNIFAPVEPYLKLAVLINDFVHPLILPLKS